MSSSSSSSRCLVFFGSDEGQASAAAQAAYAELTANSEGWGDETIDGAAPTVDEALTIINRTISGLKMVNMFGGAKTIYLKGATFMGDSAQGTKSQAIVAALEELLICLESLPADTSFCLHAMEMDKRRTFYKKLLKVAKVQEFAKIDTSRQGWERELSSLVLTMARTRGLSMSADALDLFVHRVHENSRQIGNELDKLSVFIGTSGRKLEASDIECMVPVSRKSGIFEISRAIERGNVAQAIALIDAQLEAGEAPIAIVRGAFIPTFSNRYRASLLINRHGVQVSSTSALESSMRRLAPELSKLIPTKKDGQPNYYGFAQNAMHCTQLSPAKALQALRACAEADKQLVSSSIEARVLLHRLAVAVSI